MSLWQVETKRTNARPCLFFFLFSDRSTTDTNPDQPQAPISTQHETELDMKSTDVFLTNYLKKEDVPRPITLTIASVVTEEIGGDNGKEQKAVMYFRDKGIKPMIVNKGNWINIADTYGDESDEWIGKPIEIYVDPSVMFGGKRVGGVRVRVPKMNEALPPPETWTLDQAVMAAQNAGLTKETVLSNLREFGINAWNSEKCTPLVKQMIKECESIPF